MNPLYADGFDDALIGVGQRFGEEPMIVYDYYKCVEILMNRDGMSSEEAVEYIEFNVTGAWVGPNTPLFVKPMTKEEIEDEYA